MHHAPTRIAFWAIVLSFFLLILCILGPDKPVIDKIVTGSFAVISGALGFIFGNRLRKPQKIDPGAG